MPKALGIANGEQWAYKTRVARGPLAPVLILNASPPYESSIMVRRLDTGEQFWTHRARLPCLWEEREAWYETHPQFRGGTEFLPSPPDQDGPTRVPMTRLPITDIERIRKVVRSELEERLNIPRLALTIAELAAAMGVSDDQLYKHVRNGDLTPRYSGTRMVVPMDEAIRFINELPDEDLGPL
ncbi:helix-turn-helix domain-containing protein [Microbacterium sp. ZW T5_56]|uniref:helix-turn-helix domain-containing protein n=1 Tax=Microbacterium sp. ZW T5_56 TaxID=3378081 RepID=UPI00385493E7